jgi:hypothetical protein
MSINARPPAPLRTKSIATLIFVQRELVGDEPVKGHRPA